MRNIKKILIHCSDSDLIIHDSIEVIREWHLDRGFSDIGYHYFIDKNGTVFTGRKVKTMGAHCRGQNKESIGICLSGKYDFSAFQFQACKDLIMFLIHAFDVKEKNILPHKVFNKNKTCPNFDIKKVLPNMEQSCI